MDPHIFADPDPGSQNLAYPTDPDPKHWPKHSIYHLKIKSKTENRSKPSELKLKVVFNIQLFVGNPEG